MTENALQTRPAFPLAHRTAADPLAAFLASKRSEATRRAYTQDVLAFSQHIDARDVAALLGTGVADVAAWRDAMMAEGKKPATVGRRLSGLRAFFKFAVSMGAASRNPAELVEAPTVAAHRARAPWIDRADGRALLEAPPTDTARGKRDRAILELLLRLGLRRGELTSLTLGSINRDVAGGCWTLIVSGKGGKVRELAMNGTGRTMAEYLDAAGRDIEAEPEDTPLFQGRGGRPMTGEAIRQLVNRYADRAGCTIRGGAALSAHGCRRTFATAAIDAGVGMEALRRAMGHASVSTTSRYDKRADADVTVNY